MTRPFSPSFPARPGSVAQPKLQGGPAVPPVRFGQAPQVPSAHLGGAPVQRKVAGPQLPAAAGRAAGVVQPKLAQPGPPPRVGPPAAGGQRASVQPKLASGAAPQVRVPGPPMPAHASHTRAVQMHPAPVVPGAAFGRAIQRMKRGPEESEDERATKRPKTVAEQDWNFSPDIVWTILENSARQKYIPLEQKAKQEINTLRSTPVQPDIPQADELGLTISAPNDLIFSRPGTYIVKPGNGIYGLVANTRGGYMPQQFGFEGESSLTSSNVNRRSDGLQGKDAYEELYVTTTPYESAYDKFVPSLGKILLIDQLDIRDSDDYLDWETKSIYFDIYGGQIESAYDNLGQDDRANLTGKRSYKSSNTGKHYIEILWGLSFDSVRKAAKDLGVTSSSPEAKERLAFRKNEFNNLPKKTPVGMVTAADPKEIARTLGRLAKGKHATHKSLTPSIQSSALVKAMAILGVSETYRSPPNLAHLIVQLNLIKHNDLELSSLADAKRWVPKKKDASSELAVYWEGITQHLKSKNPPSLMKPFKDNLVLFMKQKAPKLGAKIKVADDGTVTVIASDMQAARVQLETLFQQKIIQHL